MNLHLLYDNNYSQWFIESVEQFFPDTKNRYIVFNSYSQQVGKAKYVSHELAEVLPILLRVQTNLNEQIDLKETKNIIIHFFEEGLKRHICSLPSHIKVKWIVWGAETFVPIGNYTKAQLDTFSYNHYNVFQYKKEWKKGLRIFLSNYKNYIFQNNPFILNWLHAKRKIAIERIDEICTFLEGDYDLIIKNYKPKKEIPFRLFHYQYLGKHLTKDKINTTDSSLIQIGHNATPFNNQHEILAKLATIEGKAFDILLPLSYGDTIFAEKLLQKAESYKNLKLQAVKEMLPLEKYIEMLSEVKVHIFNNKRQEAMGNIIACVAQGKKVYLSEQNTAFDFFKKIGCKVFSIEQDLEKDAANGSLLQGLSFEDKKQNQQNIYEFFSVENYIFNLKNLLS